MFDNREQICSMYSWSNLFLWALGWIAIGAILMGCGNHSSTALIVEVIDVVSEQGIDSTALTISHRVGGGPWESFDTLWTNQEGKLDTSLRLEKDLEYRVTATRTHFAAMAAASGAYYLNEGLIVPGDTNRFALKLNPIEGPDPDRFTRLQQELSVSELISAMRGDTWAYNYLPRLGWDVNPPHMPVAAGPGFRHG